MKKIYLLAGAALLSASAFAQSSDAGKAHVAGTKAFVHATSHERDAIDTTGIGASGILDYLPEFLPNGGPASIYGYLGGGYIYGNNVSANNLKVCAQGYDNLNVTPVHITGVIAWFGAQESDLGSSATSKVTFSAYNMAPNKAYNTNGSGTFNSSTANFEGPSGAAVESADLMFTDIDTTDFNYIPFPAAATFIDDFAIAMDVTPLAAGDTVGLVSDNQNDAFNQDFAYHKIGTKWYVTDQLFSPATAPDLGSGGLDNDIALWAVVDDATGVDQFFNNMELTMYPNPAADKATIKYTLAKNAANVSLTVYDMHGHKVLNNTYAQQDAGTYTVDVDAANLAGGTYFYQLRSNGHIFTKQFVVSK